MSLKLGNVAINKIYLGGTLINKVYLGASQVYPTGSGGGGETLLEGFETISGLGPWTGDLEWDGSGAAVTRTSSNVTQGSFTWRVIGTQSVFNVLALTNSVDLTGKTDVMIDVYVVTNHGTGIRMSINDGAEGEADSNFFTGTGAQTLTTSIAGFGSPSTCFINVGFTNTDENGVEFYMDNLRAS